MQPLRDMTPEEMAAAKTALAEAEAALWKKLKEPGSKPRLHLPKAPSYRKLRNKRERQNRRHGRAMAARGK